MADAPKLITLVLVLDDVNAILHVLGELPSKTGAWPLIQRIREQAEPQAQGPTTVPDIQPAA